MSKQLCVYLHFTGFFHLIFENVGISNSIHQRTLVHKINVFSLKIQIQNAIPKLDNMCHLTDYTGINTTEDFYNNKLSCNNLSGMKKIFIYISPGVMNI